MAEKIFLIRPAIFAPAILTIVAAALASETSGCSLAAIPFIFLASICAQPNLNLINGCFAYLGMLLGFLLLPFFPFFAWPILMGTFSSFFLSALEKRLRLQPA